MTAIMTNDNHNYHNDHNKTTKKRRRIFVRQNLFLHALPNFPGQKVGRGGANIFFRLLLYVRDGFLDAMQAQPRFHESCRIFGLVF